VGLDDEADAGALQLVGERLPDIEGEHCTEVAHGHGVAIDGAGALMTGLVGRQVRHDLMAVEVEIDPLARAPPLGAAEQLAIKATRGSQIVHRKSQMERRKRGHAASLTAPLRCSKPSRPAPAERGPSASARAVNVLEREAGARLELYNWYASGTSPRRHGFDWRWRAVLR
jgi:hypothetical protein